MNFIIKHPSAWIPVALSLAMLIFILSYIAMNGVPAPDPEADEGIAAHLFQIWLVLEVLMVGFFAIKWLPKKPKQAIVVLTLQIAAVIAACAPVFLLEL